MRLAMAIDSSVLSPFARADKLAVLEQLTAGRRRVVPLAVLKEIDAGAPDYPRLGQVRECSWLEAVSTDSFHQVRAASLYLADLGTDKDGRNVGEAATLAWAEIHGAVALVDDGDAVRFGRRRGCTVVRTLRLITQALVDQVLAEPTRANSSTPSFETAADAFRATVRATWPGSRPRGCSFVADRPDDVVTAPPKEGRRR